jgi:hypothetical protein
VKRSIAACIAYHTRLSDGNGKFGPAQNAIA